MQNETRDLSGIYLRIERQGKNHTLDLCDLSQQELISALSSFDKPTLIRTYGHLISCLTDIQGTIADKNEAEDVIFILCFALNQIADRLGIIGKRG